MSKKTAETRPGYIPGRIRKMRRQLGLCQYELAELIGVSQPRCSEYENGRVIPADSRKMKIAEVLGTTVGYLFYDFADDKMSHACDGKEE